MRKLKFTSLIVLISFYFYSINSHAQSLGAEIEAIADIIVDIEGSGDYTSVEEGLRAVPDSSDIWTVVYVKKGSYYEKVELTHKKMKVVLVGEDVDSTTIWYDDHADAVLPGHTFSSYTFRADPHDFQAYNITFENPNTRSQAVAFHSNGDRQILYHCKMISNQDTYFDNFRTRRYIKDCFIEGDVDFIFGFGVTLFDSCHIFCNDNGYISAAATPQYYEFGYVFRHCSLSVRDGGFWKTSLGRPWFPYSNTIYYECFLPERIASRGWSEWSGRENTCIYREYNNYGPGFQPESRVPWASQLDPALAPRYNIDTIFARSNFPVDSGPVVDSLELWSMRNRFEASGYTARADTILFAGRDFYPSYPDADWSPEFYKPVYEVVKKYTTSFNAQLGTSTSVPKRLLADQSIKVLNPVGNELIISSERDIQSRSQFTLFDVSGKLVFEYALNSIPTGITKIPIASINLSSGIYVFRLETQKYQVGGRVIKI